MSQPPEDVLSRIEERLARMEAALAPAQEAATAGPMMVATAMDAVDQWATQGDGAERLERGVRLLERLTRPETLDRLEKAVDLLDGLPDLLATFGDIFDAIANQAERDGVDVGRAFDDLRQIAFDALRTAPQLRALFDSQMLAPPTVEILSRTAESLRAAGQAPPKKVGLFGALGALNDPDVQQALGFLTAVAKQFGQSATPSER